MRVLVRLERIGKRELAGLIEDGWRTRATKKLIASYERG